MSLTVFANNRSIVHKRSRTSNYVYPDVCLTPSGPATPPVPYPNIGRSEDTLKGPSTVTIDGAMPMTRGAIYARTTGDEPGIAGGIISRVVRDQAEFLTYSFDVKLEGRGAGRMGDILFHNRRNAVG